MKKIPTPSSPPRHLTSLDAFRGIAVMGVLGYHLLPNALPGGFLGVVLFLVLSGYLLTSHFLKEIKDTQTFQFRRYFWKRVKGIYPALLMVLAFSILYLTFFAPQLYTSAKVSGSVFSTLLLGNNWWQIATGSSYFAGLTPFTHLWYIGVIGQLYLLLPLLLFILHKYFPKKGQHVAILLGLTGISALLMGLLYDPQDITRVYYGTDTRAFSLLLGMVLAYLWPQHRLKEQLKPAARQLIDILGLVSLLAIIASFWWFHDHDSSLYHGSFLFFSLLACLNIAMLVHPGSNFNRWGNTRYWRFLGKHSYTLYLVQYPVMIFYESSVKNLANHLYLHALIEVLLILIVTVFIDGLLARKKTRQQRKIQLVVNTLLVLGATIVLAMPPKVAADTQKEELEQILKENASLNAQEVSSDTSGSTTANSTTATTSSSVEGTSDSTVATTTTTSSTTNPVDSPLATLAQTYSITVEQAEKAQSLPVTAVGDSVILAAAKPLKEVFPNLLLDGEVGRQLYNSAEVLQALANSGQLKETVILSLGTNGLFRQDHFDELMAVIGSTRQVYVITVRAPSVKAQNQINDLLKAQPSKYSNVHVIDWYSASNAHDDWFYDDGIHANKEGAIYYTKLVVDSILPPN